MRLGFLASFIILAALLSGPATAHAQEGVIKSIADAAFSNIGLWIGNILLKIGAILVGLAGVLLNLAVDITVLKMGSYFAGSGGSLETAVQSAWSVLRNLANIGFIFILLFIGIATILRIDKYGAKQLLRNLIIAALLINFSLFFATMVIDISNVFAKEIYFKLPASTSDCALTTDLGKNRCIDVGISGQFMSHMLLTTLYQAKAVGDSGLSIGFMGFIFLTIAAFVFFAGALMLFARFVMLILLMIFSPIAFAGIVLPATAGYAREWWRTLFNQAFFAPAFFLMIYISLLMLEGLRSAIPFTGDISSGLQGNVQSMNVIALFIIAAGFLIASLILARSMASYGAGAITMKGVNWVQSVVGRNTVGPLSRGASHLYRRGAAKVANTSVGKFLLKSTPVGAWDQYIQAGLDKGKTAKFGGKYSAVDVIEEEKKRLLELKGETKEMKAEEAVAEARHVKPPEPLKAGATAQEFEEYKVKMDEYAAEIAKVSSKLSKVTNKQFEKIAEKFGGIEKLIEIAPALSVDQLKNLEKSETISRADYERILEGRFAWPKQSLANYEQNPTDENIHKVFRKSVQDLSEAEAKLAMRVENFSTNLSFIENLSAGQTEAIEKDDSLGANRQFVKDTRKKYFVSLVKGTRPPSKTSPVNDIRKEMRGMGAPAVAKLANEVFVDENGVNEAALRALTVADLTEMIKAKKASVRQPIREHLLDHREINPDAADWLTTLFGQQF